MSKMYVLFHDSWDDNAMVFHDLQSLEDHIQDAAMEDKEEAIYKQILRV